MTVHKLSTGDGYTYLTRQVASTDEYRPAGQSLSEYYAARGNPPGVWTGGGAVTLSVDGSVVSESQMRALFGEGVHPNRDQLLANGVAYSQVRLGTPFRRSTAGDVDSGLRSPRLSVAGYDLVFTPVKSASVLWGLGGPEIRSVVADAHHAAVASTLRWIEEHAAFTRTGHDGIAQIDTTGLICAAFDHRESRTGDPDLHTHVAISNKVCGVDGKWRALDARGLHALTVAASERYNTRFEDELHARLGVTFVERPGAARGKRPVREIGGVPLELVRYFSKRRAAIEDRYAELATDYHARHGREADRSTQFQLAQQATLETREGKGPGRTLDEQVRDWTSQATAVVGARGVRRMRDRIAGLKPAPVEVTAETVDELAASVLARVSSERSTWTRWNLYAETERQARPLRLSTASERDALTLAIVERATSPDLSIEISQPCLVADPEALRRGSDGQRVYVPHGSERYTTSRILNAEAALVRAAASTTGPAIDPDIAEAALAVHEAAQLLTLDAGQRSLALTFATAPNGVVVGIGPAGAGKTTAMRAFGAIWSLGGGRVIPIATSSKAAEVLGTELGTRAENLHKFLHETRRSSPSRDPWFRLSPGDVVLVDEAGLAGTLQLAGLVEHAVTSGAAVRLVGDPAQLASVDAGGALRLLETEVGAAHLHQLHRFENPDEAAATLQLRDGNTEALNFYEFRDRIRTGSTPVLLENAYEAWTSDLGAGKTSVLIATSRTEVAALNARARLERVSQGDVKAEGVDLHDGTRAGCGDWVVTRTNLRTLTTHRGRDWVKNGDTWTVERQHRDGSLTVRSMRHHGTVRLPAEYVAADVELAYATTVHRSQGITVDAAHALVTEQMTREALYVASTRARTTTTWYVATDDLLEASCDTEPSQPQTARDVLTTVLGRSAADSSATLAIRGTLEDSTALQNLIARYEHAWQLAANDALRNTTEQALLPKMSQRILADPAAPRLAHVLADANACGANPATLLQAAVDFDDIGGVRSLAAVMASRIEDYGYLLGVPRGTPRTSVAGVPSPDVGHAGWRDYLTSCASVIETQTTTRTAATGHDLSQQTAQSHTAPPPRRPPAELIPAHGRPTTRQPGLTR